MPSSSCDNFDASKWIFVGDIEKCPHSKEQVGVCKQLQLDIKGAILCNDPDHASSEACANVPAFPSFCHLDSQVCVSGLRHTCTHFEELQRIADDAMRNKRQA